MGSWRTQVNPDKLASLDSALSELEGAFPEKLERAQSWCMHCEEERSAASGFDRLLREHRGRRIDLPIQTLREIQCGHGPYIIHGSFRRFAFFVPALLKNWLENEQAPSYFGPGSLDELKSLYREATEYRPDLAQDTSHSWTSTEHLALTTFFVSVLGLCLSASGSDPLEGVALTETAMVFGAPSDALADVWAQQESERLLISATIVLSERWTDFPLATDVMTSDAVLAVLEQRFLAEAEGARAQELSNTEETLRMIRSAAHL